MTWLWTLLGVAVFVFWVVAIVDIIRRRHTLTGAQLSAWVLLVLIFPFAGTILYFAVGRQR